MADTPYIPPGTAYIGRATTLGAGPESGGVRGPRSCQERRPNKTLGKGFVDEMLDYLRSAENDLSAVGDVMDIPEMSVQHGQALRIVIDSPLKTGIFMDPAHPPVAASNTWEDEDEDEDEDEELQQVSPVTQDDASIPPTDMAALVETPPPGPEPHDDEPSDIEPDDVEVPPAEPGDPVELELQRVIVTALIPTPPALREASEDAEVRATVNVRGVKTAPPRYRKDDEGDTEMDEPEASQGSTVPKEWVPVSAVVRPWTESGKSVATFHVYLADGDALRREGGLPSGGVWMCHDDDIPQVLESPSLDALIASYQNHVDKVEGVVFHDNAVNAELQVRLTKAFESLVALQKIPDYHPHTNGVVLDVVHPSLYPYVHGVSEIGSEFKQLRDAVDTTWSMMQIEDEEKAKNEEVADDEEVAEDEEGAEDEEWAEDEEDPECEEGAEDEEGAENESMDIAEEGGANDYGKDRWGRKYEHSQFQWLPSIFSVSSEGKCSIRTYINNMPGLGTESYSCLERLFEQFLPLMQSCYGYLSAVRFFDGDHEEIQNIGYKYEPDFQAASMKGRELKVVTKMVEYQLRPGKTFDGVWHVEGMSHERIVMTCLYILDRDQSFLGGDLLFKRAWLDYEASTLFNNVPQLRPVKAEEFFSNGLRPLGTLRTPKGRLICFPNSHVHKLSEMIREDGCTEDVLKRRIIVFWIVDPEVKDNEMPTTREIAEQQKTMSRNDAETYRLKLMEERKRHKQDFNIREIELCEH